MIKEFISEFSEMIMIGLTGAFLANITFCRAAGLDRIKNIEEDSDERIFCILQAVCSLLSSVAFWFAERYISTPASLLEPFGVSEYYSQVYLWPLLIAVVTAVVFIIVFIVTVKVAPYDKVTSAARQLPFAAFNNFAAGVILVSASRQYSLIEMIVYTAGANIGYIMANMMLREGNRRLQSREVPAAFRGLPAKLLYLSGLAIAFYALTGHSLSSLL